MSKLLPLGENIVLEALKKNSQSNSSFYIPESEDKQPGRAKVIAVGPGIQLEDGSMSKMHLEVGDEIVFRRYASDEFEVGGAKYLVIPQKDVLAKIV